MFTEARISMDENAFLTSAATNGEAVVTISGSSPFSSSPARMDRTRCDSATLIASAP